jgi:hypothetical protein
MLKKITATVAETSKYISVLKHKNFSEVQQQKLYI